ncbi:MarR family winged helix-turn-helix transcriptional regulator [Amycolatopsis sp. WGS_07]
MSTAVGGSAKGGSRAGRRVSLEAPADLAAAPGYGARRLYQAYLAAWNRHVDSVLTGPQFAVLSAVRAYPGFDQTALAKAVALDTSTMADVCRRLENRGLIVRGLRRMMPGRRC